MNSDDRREHVRVVLGNTVTVLQAAGPLSPAEILQRLDEIGDVKPFPQQEGRKRLDAFRHLLRNEVTKPAARVSRCGDGRYAAMDGAVVGDGGGGTKPQRSLRTFRTAPTANVEAVRKRLQLSEREFSEALGYSPGAYPEMLKTNKVTAVTGLAAEALLRRQAPQSTLTFLVTVVKGVPQVTMVEGAEEATIAGRTYLMIPKG